MPRKLVNMPIRPSQRPSLTQSLDREVSGLLELEALSWF